MLRLPIESLVVEDTGTKMVLPVCAWNDGINMGNKAQRIKEQQRHTRTSLELSLLSKSTSQFSATLRVQTALDRRARRIKRSLQKEQIRQ